MLIIEKEYYYVTKLDKNYLFILVYLIAIQVEDYYIY